MAENLTVAWWTQAGMVAEMEIGKRTLPKGAILAAGCLALMVGLPFAWRSFSADNTVVTADKAEDYLPPPVPDKPEKPREPDKSSPETTEGAATSSPVSQDVVTNSDSNPETEVSKARSSEPDEEPVSEAPTSGTRDPTPEKALSSSTRTATETPVSESGAGPANTAPGMPSVKVSEEPPPPVSTDASDTYGCLADATSIDTSFKGKSQIGKKNFKPAANEAIDLRGTVIRTHDASEDKVADGEPAIDSRYGLVQMRATRNSCVAGGYIYSKNPINATWEQVYDTEGLGSGYRLGTSRNNTAVGFEGENPTVAGVHWFNILDGPRFNSAVGVWTLEHSWGEYTRDDCVENDRIKSGRIFDTLFDGCYTGYSNRPSSDNKESAGPGETVLFDKVLLRMELQPGPYKSCERTSQYFGPDGAVFDQARHGKCSPNENIFGVGNLFKLSGDDSKNPRFGFKDSVFVVPAKLTSEKADFPSSANVESCENVTLVYLGDGAYPGNLPDSKFPDCFTVKSGDEGRSFWKEKVVDWHARHPEVGQNRKPKNPGDLTFPRGQLNY